MLWISINPSPFERNEQAVCVAQVPSDNWEPLRLVPDHVASHDIVLAYRLELRMNIATF